METAVSQNPPPLPTDAKSAPKEPPFGANEMRLSAREWLLTLVIVTIAVLAIPRLWKKYEHWTVGPDYRVPDSLHHDYWLYQRRLEQAPDQRQIPILGDSVIWGEFVQHDGTLSHFLDDQTAAPGRFVNCGMDGLCPLALEGLVKGYGGELHDRKVIVHCNLLWMSSRTADFSASRGESPNSHPRLLPQIYPTIPAYHADANQRLSAAIEPHSQFFGWTSHLQSAYFDNLSIPDWTAKADLEDPTLLPNAWNNPLARLSRGVPAEPAHDPKRGPGGADHKPWIHIEWGGLGDPTLVNRDLFHFEGVDLDSSLQWQAFQRLIRLLRSRGNDVMVLIGPFNEHMIAPGDMPTYLRMRDAVVKKFGQEQVSVVRPDVLPIDLYADDTHPLTDGYALLAKRLCADPAFASWLGRGVSR